METSRRTFLRGAGGALVAMPFLTSLLPRASRAQAEAPKRMITFFSPHGLRPEHFFPDPAGLSSTRLTGATSYDLTSSGDAMSFYFDDRYNRYKDRAIIARHLDALTPHNHNRSIVLGGWSDDERFDYQRVRQPHRTIDQIVGDHLYESEPFGPRVLNIGVSHEEIQSISYISSGDGVTNAAGEHDPTRLFDRLFGGLSGEADNGEAERRRAEDALVVDRVHAEYARLRDGSRISAADRLLLEEHMGHLFDLEARIRARPVGAVCSAGEAPEFIDNHYFRSDEVLADMIDIAVAAVRCDLTRVININAGMEYFPFAPSISQSYHGAAHGGDSVSLSDMDLINTFLAGKFADLLDGLDAMEDPLADGGSHLDSSVVMFAKELGCIIDHQNNSMPVALFGSAGGALSTGQLLDYGVGVPRDDYSGEVGTAYNHLLVTLMSAMGLRPEHWEPETGDWVGDRSFHYVEEGIVAVGGGRDALDGMLTG